MKQITIEQAKEYIKEKYSKDYDDYTSETSLFYHISLITYAQIAQQFAQSMVDKAIKEHKEVIKEMLTTFVLDLDQDGQPNKTITELMDLSKRAADLT